MEPRLVLKALPLFLRSRHTFKKSRLMEYWGKPLASAVIRPLQLHPPGNSHGEKRLPQPCGRAPHWSRDWTVRGRFHLPLRPARGHSVPLYPSRTIFVYPTLLKALAPFIVTGNEGSRRGICCRHLLNHLLHQHYIVFQKRLVTGKTK